VIDKTATSKTIIEIICYDKTKDIIRDTIMSIEIRNVNKKFGNFTALDNINITVPTGKLTTLLGHSG